MPFAVLLGALHGLEPGHSKTMMAAYIVAIRGTIGQAVLLGICAALSHSLIVWIVAMLGLSLGREILTSHFEAWLLIASGVIILGIAAWMLWRTGQSLGWFRRHDHGHGHHHHHVMTITDHHMTRVRTIDTGHGVVELSIFEDGVPPRWRLRTVSGEAWRAEDVLVETDRGDGSGERFRFVERDGYLESAGEIPEPHEFTARVRLSHGDHAHTYKVTFAEHIMIMRIIMIMSIMTRMPTSVSTPSRSRANSRPTAAASPRARSRCSASRAVSSPARPRSPCC